MTETQPKPCNGIFEKIYDGVIEDKITYKSEAHRVFALLAVRQATEGHTLVIPEECTRKVGLLSDESARAVRIVQAATNFWLDATFCPNDEDYVAELTAGKEVAHGHVHEIPTKNRDGLAVMATDPKQAKFVEMSPERAAEVYSAATFPPDYAKTVDALLAGDNAATMVKLQTLAISLAVPIAPQLAG